MEKAKMTKPAATKATAKLEQAERWCRRVNEEFSIFLTAQDKFQIRQAIQTIERLKKSVRQAAHAEN